jgi:hypothetical protein
MPDSHASPADTPPIDASSPAGGSLVYRPLSGFAIAGFVVGCLFAVLMLGMAAVALLQGAPFFIIPWVLVIPAAGLILSLIARSQIRGSEGTRAGERLALAGIWLSVFTGMGYAVYFYVTGLAVTSQANSVMMDLGLDSGFFPHLQKAADSPADFNAAFLLTLPATSRANVRPDDVIAMLKTYDQSGADGAPGLLGKFRNTTIGRLFLTPGQKIEVEPLGVLQWEYEKGSYTVRRTYRLTSAEASMDFSVLARSSEGEAAGAERKWFVDMRLSALPQQTIKLTPLGLGIKALRYESRRALEVWKKSLNDGKAYAFAEVDTTVWPRIVFNELQQARYKAALQDLFGDTQAGRLDRLNFTLAEDELADWEIVDGKVRVGHPFKLPMLLQGTPQAVEGHMVLETRERVDPTAVAGKVEWTIQSIAITRAVPITQKGPKVPVAL